MLRPRSLRRVGIGALVLLLLAAVGLAVTATRAIRVTWPQTTGEIALEGLSAPVTVIRDGRGVPHIYADTSDDLFRAQGFVSAQDRFFQMDLRRHITAGRLAELVGADGIRTDLTVRTLGWRRTAEEELPKLAPATRQYLSAYAEGVNDYLGRAGDPSSMAIEYTLLGTRLPDYRVDKWTEVDSLSWLKAMAWDLKANYAEELTRGRLAATLPAPMVAALYPPYPGDRHPPILSAEDWAPGRSSADSVVPPALAGPPGTSSGPYAAALPADAAAALEATASALDAVAPLLGQGDGIGSNSWVVGPSRSSTGKPLLANDPHLGVSIPGVWSQVGLHCREVSAACPFDVSGFTFAGLPGVVIGHNRTLAWGFTNLAPDVTDFYLEKVSDAAYLRDGAMVPLQVSSETIKVRGGPDVPLTVRRTVHGPILSDLDPAVGEAGRRAVVGGVAQNETYAVSLAWTGSQPTTVLDALFGVCAATDIDALRAALRSFSVPSQNVVFADTSGNIGYQAPGLVPVRRAATAGQPPGYLPAPGWDSRWDWQGWVPFEDLPWAVNPPEGVIVAANQQVTASPTPFLTSEWDAGWRSLRIRQRLEQLPKVSPQDMASIQADSVNPFAGTLVQALLTVDLSADPFTAEARDLLRDWDRSQPADQSRAAAAAAFYSAVWSTLLKLTFTDQLPPDLAPDGGGRWRLAVGQLLADPGNPWWDDTRTSGVVENRDEILLRALVQARLDLTKAISSDVEAWSWGKVHTVTFAHPVLGGPTVPGVVRALVNRGPVAVPGGSSIVNANSWDAAEGYAVTSAPSMRMVVDLADLDASSWVNPAGQSGHPGHPHYADQIDSWAAGVLEPWPFTRGAVDAARVDELTLVPRPA